ncbi:MAG: hypothetical protein ACE5F7_11575 [Nitrospiria bacterium]
MLTRAVGFITTILLAISFLDYYDYIKVTAPPLKQLVEAIIKLGELIQEKLSSF